MSDFTSTLISYDYYLENGLFERLTLPAGIDKDVLIDVILQECGEMQPVWTDPEFMRDMIGTWSRKWHDTFQKWITALNTKYDPLNNYDRTEEWTDDTDSRVISDATTASRRSSFDSDALQPYDAVDYDNTDTVQAGSVHKGHIYGNIGVTTSQAMLQAQLDVVKWNIYEHIKDLFMQDFCIMIY